jgi:hypothetical protein
MKSGLWMSMFFFVFASLAANASIRCGNCLVSEGDFKSQLYQCCGLPDLIEQTNYIDPIRPWESFNANIDYLTYNCGSSRFMQRVKLIDDKIESIDNLGWGSGPQKCF